MAYFMVIFIINLYYSNQKNIVASKEGRKDASSTDGRLANF